MFDYLESPIEKEKDFIEIKHSLSKRLFGWNKLGL